MTNHGLEPAEVMRLLDGKPSDDVDALEAWYAAALSLLKERYCKPDARSIGDKSPDFYRNSELVAHLLAQHRLVYSVRDPRAVFGSIYSDRTSLREKERRWSAFRENFQVWQPHLEAPNLLVVRFEDLIRNPHVVMAEVYRHLRLAESTAWDEQGPRKFPQRFLWQSHVDADTGAIRPFVPGAIDRWRSVLSQDDLRRIGSDLVVADFMDRFGYGSLPLTRVCSPSVPSPSFCFETELPAEAPPKAAAAPGRTRKTGRGPALILHWGKGPILTHIESSLSELGYDTIGMARSAANIPEILRNIETRRPILCVTRQRLYRQMEPVSRSLASHGCRLLVGDLGVWPHYETYLLDSRGENATSSLVANLSALEQRADLRSGADASRAECERMLAILEERASRAASKTSELGLDLTGPFTLLVLQREGDQVLREDAEPQWRDPIRLARDAIEHAQSTGRFVVIKTHPQSRATHDLPTQSPHHCVVPALKFGEGNDEQLAWLMKHARNAIVVNSTCHFQTLALGVPTACLGRGWFTGNGVVLEAENLEDAFANQAVRDGERYLCHLMSRQMPVPDYADAVKLEALMAWVDRCDRALLTSSAA